MQVKMFGFSMAIIAFIFFPANVQLKPAASLAEAEKLWERAIEAKGGRNYLHSVDSFVVIESRASKEIKNCNLYGLPDKLWKWIDLRPSVLGLSVNIVNKSLNKSFSTEGHDPSNPQNSELKPGAGEEELAVAQLTFFLETRWFKPRITGCGKESVGLKEFETIDLDLGGMPVKVFLDKNTFLPTRIAYYIKRTGRMFTWSDLFNYTNVNGILIPHQERTDGGPKVTYKIEVNPKFDPKAFERPATIEAGPDQWRKK